LDGTSLSGADRRQVAREPAHDPQPLTPPERPRVDRQPRPHQRELGRDPDRAGPLEERDELLEQPLVGGELEPEPAADPQIVSRGLGAGQS
jgi:hypothetical protein